MGKFGEIDSADTRAGKFPLLSLGAERSVPRARTPIGASGNFFSLFSLIVTAVAKMAQGGVVGF